MSGFKVPGTLTVTLENIDAVPGYDDNGNVLSNAMIQTVNAQQFTAARPTTYFTQAYTYFIRLTHDYNHHISHISGPVDPGYAGGAQLDDSWGIGHIIELTSDKPSEYKKLEINLPTCDNINVPAGQISAKKDGEDDALGTYNVTLSISIDNQAIMTASASISGGDVTATFDENVLEAQMVKWMVGSNRDVNTFLPQLNDISDDSLSDVLTATMVENDAVINQLKTLLVNEYNNVNMISSWRMILDEIPQSTGSILANYARANKTFVHGQRVFNDGDEIVIETPAQYEIKIEDYLTREVELIGQADVYGVIVQGDHA